MTPTVMLFLGILLALQILRPWTPNGVLTDPSEKFWHAVWNWAEMILAALFLANGIVTLAGELGLS